MEYQIVKKEREIKVENFYQKAVKYMPGWHMNPIPIRVQSQSMFNLFEIFIS